MERHHKSRGCPPNAVPRKAATRSSASRHNEQPLRDNQLKHARPHPPAATAAERPMTWLCWLEAEWSHLLKDSCVVERTTQSAALCTTAAAPIAVKAGDIHSGDPNLRRPGTQIDPDDYLPEVHLI